MLTDHLLPVHKLGTMVWQNGQINILLVPPYTITTEFKDERTVSDLIPSVHTKLVLNSSYSTRALAMANALNFLLGAILIQQTWMLYRSPLRKAVSVTVSVVFLVVIQTAQTGARFPIPLCASYLQCPLISSPENSIRGLRWRRRLPSPRCVCDQSLVVVLF